MHDWAFFLSSLRSTLCSSSELRFPCISTAGHGFIWSHTIGEQVSLCAAAILKLSVEVRLTYNSTLLWLWVSAPCAHPKLACRRE